MRDVIIGIDLGTTTTEAAVYRNGKAEMIPSFDGSFVIPSAVGIDDSGNMVVGERARAQYVLAPERTAIEIKRKIGTGEKICLGRKEYTAVELSAKILEYVKRYAEEYLEMPVNRAVISVPAYFDDIQRRETAEAGKLAGLTVERIINEPTAAALSYGIGHLEEESHILVYDLGGGTFDVTVLELFEGVLEVKASSGDNRLGGKDLDQRLIDWLAGRFEEKTGVSLKGNVYAASRLKEAAEQCKIALSSQEEATVRIPMLAQDGQTLLGLEETVSREQFESLIEKEIHRTKGPVQTALGDSGVSCGELDRILLAGGSTRIPLVRREIRDMLGKEPSEAIHPEYSIALGAAIQAGIISGAIDGEDSMVLTDVNPYTLGIRAMGWESDDEMSVIIPRNVTIPVTRKQTYYTSWDGQQAAAIEVYQGEKRRASRNHLIGSFDIGDIPPAPAGKEQIEVSFSYNLDGILQVAAKVVSTGKEASVTIHMGQEETKEDVSGWKESGLAADFRSVIRRGEKALKKAAERGDKELAGELEETLYDLKYAVLKELQVRAEELEEDLRDLIEEGEQ
ncbi:MAG TPA: Hsp70 family protein [Candidatus Limivivens intestinipullorum]|uniref:Chaperone protein DnaK n=1 Tax=Candidatus Limivivens intestinipullorum TaxID=2840858 RepID=A0A9D1ETL5_9FIRM|nr:Hsp70 family protein [Candidatus Limivivens intestinipullorum]